MGAGRGGSNDKGGTGASSSTVTPRAKKMGEADNAFGRVLNPQ